VASYGQDRVGWFDSKLSSVGQPLGTVANAYHRIPAANKKNS
jgi:hypothetical protein